MKKKIYITILGIASLILLTACDSKENGETTSSSTTVNSDTTTAANGDMATTATEKQYDTLADEVIVSEGELDETYEGEGFSMGLTGEWTHMDNSGVDFFIIEGVDVQMSIIADKTGMTKSLEECRLQMTAVFTSTDGYNLISVGNVTLNEYQGIVFNYNFTAGGQEYQGRQYIVQADTDFYALTFVAGKEEFTEYEDEAMNMFSTFKTDNQN